MPKLLIKKIKKKFNQLGAHLVGEHNFFLFRHELIFGRGNGRIYFLKRLLTNDFYPKNIGYHSCNTNKFHASWQVREQEDVVILSVTFLTTNGEKLYLGGAERYLIDLCNLLTKNFGRKVSIYQAASDAVGWVQYFQGIKIVGIPVSGDYWKLNESFHTTVKNTNLTIYSPFYLATPNTHPHNIAISHGIFWDHESLQNNEWMSRICNSVIKSNKIVSVDTNTINFFRAYSSHLAENNKFKYIPNYFDNKQFIPSHKKFDLEFTKTNQYICITYPRRAYKPRGFYIFLEAAKSLLEETSNTRFLFVGQCDSPQEEELIIELICTFPDRVDWKEVAMHLMPEIYQISDIVVIPTVHSEGTSLSCIEAMASGCAVIATNVGGLTDIIINEYNGLLIDPSSEALKESIIRLITNPEFRLKLAQKACETAFNSFRKELWNQSWSDLLAKVLVENANSKPSFISSYNFNIIYPATPGIDWGIVHQRPHHIMEELSKEFNCYFQEWLKPGKTEVPYRELSTRNGLAVVDERVKLTKLKNPILYIHYPGAYESIYEYEDPIVIYDVLDSPNIHHVSGHLEKMDLLHEKMLIRADIVTCSNIDLLHYIDIELQRLHQVNKPLIFVGNGVDCKHFNIETYQTKSSQTKQLKLTYHNTSEKRVHQTESLHCLTKIRFDEFSAVIGYYGAITDDWFDIGIIEEILQSRSDWLVILCGPVSSNIEEKYKSLYAKYNNFRLIAPLEYKLLPSFLGYIDVAIIPFKLNEIIHYTSPLKMYEYLSAGIPVVTTGFADALRNSDVVSIGSDGKTFVKAIEFELSQLENQEMKDKRKNKALQYDWNLIVRDLKEAIKKVAFEKWGY